jgi:hypothetical protein
LSLMHDREDLYDVRGDAVDDSVRRLADLTHVILRASRPR